MSPRTLLSTSVAMAAAHTARFAFMSVLGAARPACWKEPCSAQLLLRQEAAGTPRAAALVLDGDTVWDWIWLLAELCSQAGLTAPR